jgi:hypothetical protein
MFPFDVFRRLERTFELSGKPLLVSEWFFRSARPGALISYASGRVCTFR